MTTTVFNADVDSEMLNRASEVLANDGITLIEAFRQMLTYIVVESRMPDFECFDPNEETLTAMSEANQGNLVTIGSVADLMAELNEDD